MNLKVLVFLGIWTTCGYSYRNWQWYADKVALYIDLEFLLGYYLPADDGCHETREYLSIIIYNLYFHSP